MTPSRWRDDDQGVLSIFGAVVATALVFVAGVAYDGGQYIKTYLEANNLAESAARAGAQASDPSDLLTGRTGIDPAAAQARVAEFLANAGHGGAGRASVSGARVTVTVTLTQSAHILPLGPRAISAAASATAVRGVEAAAP
ncbi:MAG TPA: pilus assembly protein TadG-related protein [Acidimicrobiales bacterium]|nr:pilus assembly protein TadG-related protein [Acidimicrobiales bacterium]